MGTGFATPVEQIRLVRDGRPIAFTQQDDRVILTSLPRTCPDPNAGVTVLAVTFSEPPQFRFASRYAPLHAGVVYSTTDR